MNSDPTNLTNAATHRCESSLDDNDDGSAPGPDPLQPSPPAPAAIVAFVVHITSVGNTPTIVPLLLVAFVLYSEST